LRGRAAASAAVSTAVGESSAAAGRAAAEPGVQVIHGASVQTLALAGLTISQARSLVEAILGVGPSSPVLVNGRPVRPSYSIAQGDVLEFVHHAGEKGGPDGFARRDCGR
jgi:hypothetical protein